MNKKGLNGLSRISVIIYNLLKIFVAKKERVK
jgi:hypothetical protein